MAEAFGQPISGQYAPLGDVRFGGDPRPDLRFVKGGTNSAQGISYNGTSMAGAGAVRSYEVVGESQRRVTLTLPPVSASSF